LLLCLAALPAAHAQIGLSPTGRFEFAISHGFGSVPVGSTSPVLTIYVHFASATTLDQPSVVTMGAPNHDFQFADGGTCAATSYAAGDTCTIQVAFTPTLAGSRRGALLLPGSSAGGIKYISFGIAYLYGSGSAPQIAYEPGTQTTIASGLDDPEGVAVDGSGNVYISEFGNGQILKVAPGQSPVVETTLISPTELAVTSDGNVLAVATSGAPGPEGYGRAVWEIFPSGFVGAINTGAQIAAGVAVGNRGFLWATNDSYDDVARADPSFGSPIYFACGFTPGPIAADPAGNLYIIDNDHWLVWKYTPSGAWSTIGSGYNRPSGLAVDAKGNLYVADFGNDRVLKVSQSGDQTTVGSGLITPTAVAVDSLGNVYIADFGNQRVVEVNHGTPPAFTFEPTKVGQPPRDSPRILRIRNMGTTNLVFASTAATLSANFSFGSATTCPVVSSEGSSFTLAPAQSCIYAVKFTPTQSGPITGSLTITDNNLNGSNATQSIALSGTAN
jgi:sugar lactone lactonase YvrE